MNGETIVFAVEDVPSYSALRPVAERWADDADVEFLFVDSLYPEGSGKRIPQSIKARHDHRTVDEYVRFDTPLFTRFPSGMAQAALQKLLLDDCSYQVGYDVEGYLEEVAPDVFVCAMDSLPFVRHVVRALHDRDATSVAVQHGMYPKNLDREWLSQRYGPLSPDFSPPVRRVEVAKRWLAFRYGLTVYCNPYVDVVCTLGEFFTERIRDLRSEYPCFGKTAVVTTGSPEYEGPVEAYRPDVESFLFLSQQQYEGGHWNDEQLDWVIRRLERVDERIPVTVRPHPKDSCEKRERYAEAVSVSNTDELAADVRAHDVVVTTHSTAVTEGALQGKVCGVLRVPWDDGVTRQDFPAFRHEHVVQIGEEPVDFERAAARRSVETQRDFLRRFCYTPALDGRDGARSVDAIDDAIESVRAPVRLGDGVAVSDEFSE